SGRAGGDRSGLPASLLAGVAPGRAAVVARRRTDRQSGLSQPGCPGDGPGRSVSHPGGRSSAPHRPHPFPLVATGAHRASTAVISRIPYEPLYGRDHEVSELCNLLIAEGVVILHSPSGAGKTSLINAGLIKAME